MGSPFGGPKKAQGATVAAAAATAAEGEGGAKSKTKTRYEIVQEQLRRESEDARRIRLSELPPDAPQQEEEEEEGRPKSPIETGLRKVWMGSEKAGWKERRLAEEQEKISQGEGYGGMIMDQIWEVWNWGREKGEELERREEEVPRERRRREGFPEIGKVQEK